MLDPVSVTVELTPGLYEGRDADWWVLASTPVGWYFRNVSGQWQYSAGGTFTPAYQGTLLHLNALEVLEISGLPAGNYTFYFGVDARDGVLDSSSIWYASIQLTVY